MLPHTVPGSYKTWTGFWTGMESGISSLMARTGNCAPVDMNMHEYELEIDYKR